MGITNTGSLQPTARVAMSRTARMILLATLAAGCDGSHGMKQPAPGGRRGQDGGDMAGGQRDDAGGTGGSDGSGGAVMCPGSTFGGAASPWSNPEVQCHWTGGGDRYVLATPLVVDLDGDGMPEIVFPSSPHTTVWGTEGVRLHAISGETCKELWGVPAEIEAQSQIAAGDLDGDGRPEIVGLDSEKIVLRVYGPTGLPVGASDHFLLEGEEASGFGGPAIADVDGIGRPEVIFGANVLRLEGEKLVPLWRQRYPVPPWGTLALVADADLDGRPEVVTGNRIFDGATGVDETPPLLASVPAGYPAIAQFDPATPEPEIVLISSGSGVGQVRLLDVKSGAAIFGPYDLVPGLPMVEVGGAPTVADFDGDRLLEIGVAGPTEFRVYDPECAAAPPPDKCAGPGLLWKSTTRDLSSGSTSASVFDFNRDCQVEVVYRDECWLRIYEGRTGKVLAAFNITSDTILEEPVVADVDGDGHAEIVVSSDDMAWRLRVPNCPEAVEEHTGAPWTGYTQGVFVLRDPMERWAPARRVWNQHTYHVTNIKEDATIPIPEPRSWDGHNGYRQNVSP